uniref:Anaphylatoxin-like domain-containing protein n=1 Tax=Dicentrarchus labrax TaxID=13489 RepID=A0A8C4HKE0_DICLA
MSRTLLWLVASLAFASLTSLADGAPLQVMSAPNLLRVGTPENIFVECQDCTGGDIRVDIKVMNHPTKTKELATTSVTLTTANNFQEFGKLTIPAGDFNKDPSIKQYVYLQARFPDRLLEKVVLVSFQSGYIFIQTDKTLYTPNSDVRFRVFALTPRMESTEIGLQTIDIEIVVLYFIFDNFIIPNGEILFCVFLCVPVCSFGLWKVVARFTDSPQQSYTAEFEVKEYVLPSFEVKLIPQSPFFYVDSEELSVDIKATYLFGEEVNGMAYVLFGVIQEGQKNSFPSSLQNVQVSNVHILTILLYFWPSLCPLVTSLYVNVFLFLHQLTGSEMVEAELKDIQIVNSPYSIHFTKTPKYYKPRMSFDVTVEVLNPDGSPAEGITVVVNRSPEEGRTGANGIARLTINTDGTTGRLIITANTADDRITPERQASATMVALPYITKNNKYIHIGVDGAEVKLGQRRKVNFYIPPMEITPSDMTYLILSRGQLVSYGRYKTEQLISMMVPITKEMLPSFRILAYYHTNDNEVVSDSVWVDVEDSCMGSLKLEQSRPVTSYEPRKRFLLKVTGDPEATVGLVAVDKGVYILNNKHRLTQKKVWDIVEKYDTGCTPGGGKDSMSVFYDAGLLFESSTASGTPYRLELKCPAPSRRRRNTIMEVTTSLDQLQRDCCLDGIKDIPVSYTCERRSEYITDGAACVEAFLHCCKEMESQRAERKEDNLQLARSDSSYMNIREIVLRTKFPESWLWKDIKLPACQTPNCDTTSVVENVALQDSITTWQFTGISLSRTHGICVGNPLEIIVRKDFFIDLRLPYSAVRGEQIEIKAILHNYSPDLITVRVDLIEEEHVCSAAHRRGKYRQEVKVGDLTTRSVSFIIIPMKEGKYPITVKAAVKDSSLNDGIMKMLRVVSEGVMTKSSKIIIMDPTNKGVEQVSPLENAISGNSMGSLIFQPWGCGEQNLARMTLPVIATIYLDQTNQWEAVGFDKRKEALQHIKTGYENELAYRKNDGSFTVFQGDQSSTWLTAYVAKVFAMAKDLVAVQNHIICDAVKFLILNAQQPDGMFREDGYVFSNENNYILQGSIDKAVGYLETRLPNLIYSYAVAITSYALANENKLNQKILYKFASSDLSHWPVLGNKGYTLEATAYALLALVKAEVTTPVVRWFNQQQNVGGGFGSTQATIIVYQAVSEYWANAKEPEYDLKVDILLPGRSKPDKFVVNSENHFTTRTSRVRTHTNTQWLINVITAVPLCIFPLLISASVYISMVSLYYALPKEKENYCQEFNLSVELRPGNLSLFVVILSDTRRIATMSILDIGLLTGFTANTNDLNLLSKGPHFLPLPFSLSLQMSVGVLQPAAVSVYEYNNRESERTTPCVKFYHPERRAGQLLQLCRNDVCRECAEENCSMQKKGNIDNDDRTAKACESTETNKIDFGKRLQLDCIYVVLLSRTITVYVCERTTDVGPRGKQRTFLSPMHCRQALDLREGKTYLIMGTSKDIKYLYVLGERTWIEYWPSEAECQTEEYGNTCRGLEALEQGYGLFGCQQ